MDCSFQPPSDYGWFWADDLLTKKTRRQRRRALAAKGGAPPLVVVRKSYKFTSSVQVFTG